LRASAPPSQGNIHAIGDGRIDNHPFLTKRSMQPEQLPDRYKNARDIASHPLGDIPALKRFHIAATAT